MDIIDNKICELQKRLMPYQWSSVNAICNRFESENRALLADEVGLGKTEITKGVIAMMAKSHYQSHKMPFRVAYICPNQNVAKQNYPKLQIFPFILQKNEDIANMLDKILEKYKASSQLTKNQQEFVKKSSVYTRVCDWLICIYRGGRFEDIIENDIKKIYGFSNSISGISASTEASVGDGKPQVSKILQIRADELLKSVLDCLKTHNFSTYQVLNNFWELSQKNELPKTFYAFNKKVASYFRGSFVEDYRLSMQHLYSAETCLMSSEKVMHLESLTPSTSLKINNSSNGKDLERALIQATLEKLFAKELKTSFFQGGSKAENFKPLLDEYKSRLNTCNFSDDELKKKLPNKNPSIPEFRKIFIEHNISKMHYDLIIMDEFQNFADLVTKEASCEAEYLAKALFNKENTKILLLSATPFEIANTVFDDLDDEELTQSDNRSISKDHISDFYNLYQFLNPKKSTFETEWKNAINADIQTCENLLYQGGIFRTERISATKNSPIHEKNQEISFDFNYPLLANKFINQFDNNYRTDYSISTPYALSFASGYKLFKDDTKSISSTSFNGYEKLFLTENELTGNREIVTTNKAFEKLKQDIFKINPQYLLWIPPANPSRKLDGVFKGAEGFSKTLIFANYRMTPMAFTYLLTNKANVGVCSNLGESSKAVIEQLLAFVSYDKTKEALALYFEKIFESPIGKQAVFQNFKQNNHSKYSDMVEKYCEDGCFCDMIAEYIKLLENEYDKNDFAMASAIKNISNMQISRPNLIYKGQTVLQQGPVEAANLFAVGLFSETQNGDTEKRLSNIKGAFNSPFWPFVFTTTSIGTEGIDLHWYARNVVHWSVPKRPIDLEQREGRVLRYNCHAVRLNQALISNQNNISELSCLNKAWEKSGLYNCQLNFFSDIEKEPSNEGCYHVVRKTYFNLQSSQLLKYQRAKKMVSIYRELIGRNVNLAQTLSDLHLQNENKIMCLAPFINETKEK